MLSDLSRIGKTFLHSVKEARLSLLAGEVYSVLVSFISYLWIWLWLKIKDRGLRRFSSLVPIAKVPFWYMFLSHSHISDSWLCEFAFSLVSSHGRKTTRHGSCNVRGQVAVAQRARHVNATDLLPAHAPR